MIIRNARTQDASALGRVYCRAWKTGYSGILPDGFLAGLTDENCAPGRINDEQNLVVLDAAQVVGLVNFGPARDADRAGWGEIRAIYVLPEYWNEGYGKTLFDCAVERLRTAGFDKTYLWVLEKNARARRFYESRGMTATAARKTVSIGGESFFEIAYETAR